MDSDATDSDAIDSAMTDSDAMDSDADADGCSLVVGGLKSVDGFSKTGISAGTVEFKLIAT